MKKLVEYLVVLPVVVLLLLANFNKANGADITPRKEFHTSQALSVDDWLFSEGLFPDHEIPQNLAHHDAIKLFSKLMDDHDILAEAYDKYRLQHDKQEVEDEVKFDAKRLHFKDNLHTIFQHNLNHDAGQSSYQMGVNLFSDMSREEMSYFLGANDKLPIHPKNFNASAGPGGPGPHGPMAPPVGPQPVNASAASTITIHSYDLRDLGVVTSVKNQKKCGSCVHFAHCGLMEALYALKYNGLHVNLAEQMMLDCAVPEHGYVNNAGCNGNIMEDSGQFLIDHGVTHEHHYKYKAKQDVCEKEGKEVVAQLKDYWKVDTSVDEWKNVLYTLRQPIAAAFLVHPTFMHYRTGVFDGCAPPHGYIGGHAVLVTGFGNFMGTEYWIVKNSWGSSWGEKGFFKYISGSSFCKFERWGFTGVLV